MVIQWSAISKHWTGIITYHILPYHGQWWIALVKWTRLFSHLQPPIYPPVVVKTFLCERNLQNRSINYMKETLKIITIAIKCIPYKTNFKVINNFLFNFKVINNFSFQFKKVLNILKRNLPIVCLAKTFNVI
jgi:hypothetical protein